MSNLKELILGRDEKLLLNDIGVYYPSHKYYESCVRVSLALTNKRFLFVQQNVAKKSKDLKQQKLEIEGIRSILIDQVRNAITETQGKKKMLILSFNTREGVENASFEVFNPERWKTAIERGIAETF